MVSFDYQVTYHIDRLVLVIIFCDRKLKIILSSSNLNLSILFEQDNNATPPPVQEEAKAEESAQVVDTQTTEEIKPEAPAAETKVEDPKPEVPAETPPVVEQPPPEEEKKQEAAPVEPPKPVEDVKAQEEEKPAIQISMDSLKQPDPPAESQDSFVKLDASMTSPSKNVKEAPSAVQNDYIDSPSKQESSAKKRPGLVGIQGFQEQTNYSEIESPMRKRKGALQKLKLDNDSDEDHAK